MPYVTEIEKHSWVSWPVKVCHFSRTSFALAYEWDYIYN